MNEPRRTGSLSRFLITLLSVVMISAMFLFTPFDRAIQPTGEKSLYEQYLSGTASGADKEPVNKEISIPDIRQTPVSVTIEAETLHLKNPMCQRAERDGFNGDGYVGTLPADTDAAMIIPLHIKATQHYDITVCAAADQTCENALSIDDTMISRFTLDGTGQFTKITFYGIFLKEGDVQLKLDGLDGGLDLDYIMLRNDNTEYRPDFSVTEKLCDPDAEKEAQQLYTFLREQWGKTVLTGQYVSDNSNRELNLIYQLTGQLPAIRFCTLGTGSDNEQIQAAIDWNVYTHGIVGLMWQWNAPGTESVYADGSDFRFYHALYRKDPESVAKLTPDQADHAVKNGTLSEEARLLLQDIDSIAGALKKLDHMHIPVLWRPLHEAGGGWFWWGASGREAYQNLWMLLWHRLTDYHGLHNLIWIWNGQSAAYLVPEQTYDIASVDVYLQPRMEFGSRYEQYISLARLTNGRKLLALSECSTLPSPEMMQLDASVWSFFGLWYGDYLMKPDGTFNDANYTSMDLYNLYNSELTLSLNDFLSIYK